MKETWQKWKQVTEKIGNFQLALIFSLFYILIVIPLGLIVRLFSDYLMLKESPKWSEMEDNTSSILKMKDQ